MPNATTQDDDDDDESSNSRDLQTPRSERLEIIRNLLCTLPTIHWSLPKWDTDPWLTSDLLNTLVWLESVVCLHQGRDL
jgi:hypothetical protein